MSDIYDKCYLICLSNIVIISKHDKYTYSTRTFLRADVLMGQTIRFRRAVSKDKPFLLTLRQLTMNDYLKSAGIETSDRYHLSRIDEYFDDSNIIELGEQPIGLLKLSFIKNNIHIRQFQIMPEFQGQGIGSRILTLTQKKAEERGLGVTLNVLLANPALALYQRKGFRVVGQNTLEFQMRWTA